MDDSVRAEYERRLAAGDRQGALAYIRRLRTQASDPAERAALNQALAEIEGTDSAEGAAESNYSGSAGPFGDNAQQWAAEHAPRAVSGYAGPAPSAEAPPSYGGSPSYPGTSAEVPAAAPPPSYGGSPSYPGTSAGIPDQNTISAQAGANTGSGAGSHPSGFIL